jgi:hypothetical protein
VSITCPLRVGVHAEFPLFGDPWDLRATRLALDILIGHLPAGLNEPPGGAWSPLPRNPFRGDGP